LRCWQPPKNGQAMLLVEFFRGQSKPLINQAFG